jgi:hypothetical protein
MEAAIVAHDARKQNELTACESMREGILVYRVQMYNHRCITPNTSEIKPVWEQFQTGLIFQTGL